MASSKRHLNVYQPIQPNASALCRQSIEVWSFKPFWSEVEKKVEEWLLVSLIYSLSLLYLIQMKMQLLFFRRKRIFLKKEAGFDIIGAHFNFA